MRSHRQPWRPMIVKVQATPPLLNLKCIVYSLVIGIGFLTSMLLLSVYHFNIGFQFTSFSPPSPSQTSFSQVTRLSQKKILRKELSLNENPLYEHPSPERSFDEYRKPLQCIDEFTKIIDSKPIGQLTKDLLKLYVQNLNAFSREIFLQSRKSNDVITSGKEILEGLEAHKQCPTHVTLPTVAICTVQKGSGPFVQEWLSYYLIHGVTKIVLYDNSVPDSPEFHRFRKAVHPFIESGHVAVKDWFVKDYRQKDAFNDCFYDLRESFSWVAFFDVDEYMVIKAPLSTCIPEFLTNYYEFPGLHVKWLTFTPLGVPTHNFSSLFLEQYLWYRKREIRGKTIIQTKYTKGMHIHGAEHAVYAANFNSHGEEGYWDENPHPYEHVELRHYWGMDWAFAFLEKVCGESEERARYFDLRVGTLLALLDSECCTKVQDEVRQVEPLRKFYYGKK